MLDTHTFFWFVLNRPSLSPTARGIIANPDNEIDVSPATYWEIAIKIRLGKYILSEPVDIFMERELDTNQFRVLHIDPRHVAPLASMPFHHRDPFDRLLIAQAMAEGIPLISADDVFDKYPVERRW
ncbi:MAG: type II toxin-antitoxin system VapC family toxin [Blastocatellia bacterium]|nr:type II toxin-antitoxin system VapC family toxin [Blastocatellia bacterium]